MTPQPHKTMTDSKLAVRDRIDTITSRMDDVESRLGDAIADNLTVQQARAVTIGVMGIATLSVPAAAQSVGELGSAMCGTGIGQLIGLVFIGAAMFYLLKAILQGMGALDKMNSTKQGTQNQGKEEISNAASTGAAAFLPALAAGVFEIMNINTVSCLAPESWSVIGTIVVGVPF